MTTSRAFFPLSELADRGRLPLGEVLDDVMDHVWLASPEYDAAAGQGVIGVFVDQEIAIALPGVPMVQLGLGSGPLGIDFDVRVQLPPALSFGIEVPLTLRVGADILRPLKPGTDEPDTSAEFLAITLGTVKASVDSDGHFSFDIPGNVSVPRCMLGSTGVILGIGSLRWLTPNTDLSGSPAIAARIPPNFTGLYLENVSVEVTSLPIQAGQLNLEYGFIGTGGFTGVVDWSDTALRWNGNDFENGLSGELFGFKGALSKVKLGFRQNALTECEVSGNIFAPYLDRVIGLSIGFDGHGGITAVASTPTCAFTDAADGATGGPAGYLITADTDVFKLDISRVALQAGGDAPASLSVSGRAKLKLESFDLPAVVFQGLSIDTQGRVAVEGGWLDVDTAKSGGLSGFPIQITKIGFGAESATKRWVGLNGGLKLADGLPVGASVEGLRVAWDADTGQVGFSLEGVGLELKVPGVFSFAGKVAFFSNSEATGFRGTLKLSLDSLKVTVDAALMIGRTSDGMGFFFFYLDVGLPVGIPLFSTGAAIYGFAGLLAVNLKPARAEGEHWYHGYYRRPARGVTDPAKWAIQRDAFAIGLGTTIGSLPDTGFAISAKVLLILVLPGPQLLLNGKGQFISKKPDEKDANAEGTFEALLVLDIPAKLFQANLAVAFKIASLVEIEAGLDVAFSWAPQPPEDIWHVYLGEKSPEERRIHATLFKILQGDSWLMINRAHRWPPGLQGRAGDFEIGGSLAVGFKFDFTVVKAWLDASLVGEAAITWDPQQFTASVTLKGSAGVSALGLTISGDLLATADVRAPSPWFLTAEVSVAVKIDLVFFKWEFSARLPFELGDPAQPLPEPVTGIVTLDADHLKVDEARALEGAIVAPDARPLLSFRRPVRDLARFGSPGRDDVPVEDLATRQFSYRLRHVVLVRTDAGTSRLVGAAGTVTLANGMATFAGLAANPDALPNLAGAKLTLFRPGEGPYGPFTVSAGGGSTATVVGNPPGGEFSYRLSAPQPSVTVQLGGAGTPDAGDVTLTVTTTIADPTRFRGGSLVVGSAYWLVLEATANSVRVRAGSAVPTLGPATLLGPAPALIEGQWYPAGDPVDGADSSTRLQLWARTPYAFFRHNEVEAVSGLDAFKPGYACGPEAIEDPICSDFSDVATGLLAGEFTTAGLLGRASGSVVAVAATGVARRLELGASAARRGAGTVSFELDPPADAVWVTAERREVGWASVWRDGALVDRRPLESRATKMQFTGGVERVQIDGTDAIVHALCFVPGWTCTTFDENTFPAARSGEVAYAGVTLLSDGTMRVAGDTLQVVPSAVIEGLVRRLASRVTEAVRAAPRDTASDAAVGLLSGSLPPLAMAGLVEPVDINIPGLGPVTLVPGLTPVPDPGAPGGGRPIPVLPPQLSVGEPRPPLPRPPFGEIRPVRVWSGDKPVALVTLTVVFPRPVTRVRVRLVRAADVLAFAGAQLVTRGAGAAGDVVSLFADPRGTAHVGWLDRVVISTPGRVEISSVCTDAGDFGWKRYEQWKWSQGVRRSVESLYSLDPVLAPGAYELRAHTATVVTGANPREDLESTRASFTVGDPPGFASQGRATVLPGVYPNGGPLTDLATYVASTLPRAGAPLWYRELDTAVAFSEAYITRLYLEAGQELRVFVVNASGAEVRAGTRHVWAAGELSFDAFTEQYVRTLNGDGSDPCATVSLDRVARPETVIAGGGVPLEPARLHAAELRTTGAQPRVVHRFEFTTSRYVSFRHHLALFDGRCRRLPAAAVRIAPTTAPRAQATARVSVLAALTNAVTAARSAASLAASGAPSTVVLDAAKATADALAAARADARSQGTAGFEALWAACFGAVAPGGLPEALRLSVVQAADGANGTDLLLLESPEPVAWDRVTLDLARAAAVPRRRVTTSFTTEFGRPDQGFEVSYGGLRWLANVELWVVDGGLRARADVPLDVVCYLDRASTVELVLRVDSGGAATITATPPLPGGAITVPQSTTPSALQTVTLTPAPGTSIGSVRVVGPGVAIERCTCWIPLVPVPAMGPLRFAAITLPTAAAPLDHEVTLLAVEGLDASGYSIRWMDATTPAASELYATVGAVDLQPGARLRLVPGRASVTPTDDAIVQPGGAGSAPPATGAVYQLLDPNGHVVQEAAALPLPAPGSTPSVVAFPNADDTRAFLVPPAAAAGVATGHWALRAMLRGDAAPDLERWSVNNTPIIEGMSLRFYVS